MASGSNKQARVLTRFARRICSQNWALAQSANPGAIAAVGAALIIVFGMALPATVSLFLEGFTGPTGKLLEIVSSVTGTLSRGFGYGLGLVCWGAALGTWWRSVSKEPNLL